MKHENETLVKISELRAQILSPNLLSDKKVEITNELDKNMKNLMIAVESYPDLKANEQFIMFQRSMNEMEEQISAARRTFNMGVTQYNNKVDMFPTNIMADMLGFKRKHVLEISEKERENVNVGELFKN